MFVVSAVRQTTHSLWQLEICKKKTVDIMCVFFGLLSATAANGVGRRQMTARNHHAYITSTGEISD